MKTLGIDLADRSYDILIGQALLPRVKDFIPQLSRYRRTLIVSNPVIDDLYGSTLVQGMEQAGLESERITVPEGESYKTLQSAEKIYDRLVEGRYDRNTLLVALGGGVIGDLTGFVAATYQRGVPFVQVPTTLLSQVDSSVGGKTAVNHPRGKNLIGAFYQPQAVVIDLDTLQSLPSGEFRAGLAEVIKYGVIADPELFAYLESQVDRILALDVECLSHIIETSCAIKANVVEKDETESNYRMVLNYGHTLGHAVEALTSYTRYKHGEAVAIGMVYAAQLSRQLGKCSENTVNRIRNLVAAYGLPVDRPQFPVEEYIGAMYLDKKVRDNHIKFILVNDIGDIEIANKVNETDLERALTL